MGIRRQECQDRKYLHRLHVSCERTTDLVIQGNFSIIKDCVRIEDNSVLLPGTVVTSFSVYGGNPGNLDQMITPYHLASELFF